MITNELLSFIKEALAKGTTEEEIRKMLMDNGGWDESDVREAFDTIGIYSSTYQGAVSKAFQGGVSGEGVGMKSTVSEIRPEVESVRITPITIQSIQPREPAQQEIKPQAPQSNTAGQAGSGVGANMGNMHARLMSGEFRSERAFPYSPSFASSVSSPISSPPPASLAPKLSPQTPATSVMPNVTGGVGDAFAAVRGITTEKTPDIRFSAVPPLSSPIDNDQFLQSFAAKPEIKTGADPKTGATLIKPKKSRAVLYFLLFLFILLAFFGGASFAYLKGYIPGISIPFLDEIGGKLPSIFPRKMPGKTVELVGENIVIADTQGRSLPPAPAPENPKKYYNDRIFISLPAGTPVAVTTLASTIAGELRGRVETCTYNIGEHGCVIITPVQTEAELEAIVADLKKDTRVKGAERVEIPL